MVRYGTLQEKCPVLEHDTIQYTMVRYWMVWEKCPVLEQDTTVHYYSSLYGTLFIDTVQKKCQVLEQETTVHYVYGALCTAQKKCPLV